VVAKALKIFRVGFVRVSWIMVVFVSGGFLTVHSFFAEGISIFNF